MKHTSLSRTQLDQLGFCGQTVLEDPTLATRQKKQRVTEKAESLGLSDLGAGSGRIVFADTDRQTVIKVPFASGKTVGGITQNKQEHLFWEETNNPNCFFEVYAVSNPTNPIWLLMEQATYTVSDPEFNLTVAQDQLADDLQIEKSHEVLNEENIGFSAKDNRYKVIDYGSYLDGL